MSDVQYLLLNKVRNCRISKEKAYNPPMNEVSAYRPEGSRNPSPTVSANSTLGPRISLKGLLRFWVSTSCAVWNCFPQKTSFPPPGSLWSLQEEVYKLGKRIYPQLLFHSLFSFELHSFSFVVGSSGVSCAGHLAGRRGGPGRLGLWLKVWRFGDQIGTLNITVPYKLSRSMEASYREVLRSASRMVWGLLSETWTLKPHVVKKARTDPHS